MLKVCSYVVSLHRYGYTAHTKVFTLASSRSKCNQVTLQRYFWQICILNFLYIDNWTNLLNECCQGKYIVCLSLCQESRGRRQRSKCSLLLSFHQGCQPWLPVCSFVYCAISSESRILLKTPDYFDVPKFVFLLCSPINIYFSLWLPLSPENRKKTLPSKYSFSLFDSS